MILGESGESEEEKGNIEAVKGFNLENQVDFISKTAANQNDLVNFDSADDEISLTSGTSDSSSSEIDEWFTRFHPLHEPLRPTTPPGPLISPERRGGSRLLGQLCLKASPLKLETESFGVSSSFPQSPSNSKSGPFINTPSKGPNTRIGLRSKPARVLKSSSGPSTSNSPSKSFINSSPSSLIRTTNFFQDSNTARRSSNSLSSFSLSPNRSASNRSVPVSPIRSASHRSDLVSPIRSAAYSPLFSPTPRTPLKSQSIQSHSPSLSSTDSTISLSVSSLTKNGLARELISSPIKQGLSSSMYAPPSSPLKMKSKYSEGCASPLRNSIGVLQLQPEVIKRKRPPHTVDSIDKQTTVIPSNPVKNRKQPKIDAELEDIKRLLSQHNSRIRPNHNNNKRKP